MNNNNHINYIEFKATNLATTKAFYQNVFGWEFTDYGENYTSFENSGVAGGFEKTNDPIQNGVLVVIHHEDLVEIKAKVTQNKGVITKEIFSFPGGKRFQFKDPSGNELAVWTEVASN